MPATRKITLEVPEDLLAQVQAAWGARITEAIRQGLRLVAAGRAYGELRKLRGKLDLSLDLDTLREGR